MCLSLPGLAGAAGQVLGRSPSPPAGHPSEHVHLKSLEGKLKGQQMLLPLDLGAQWGQGAAWECAPSRGQGEGLEWQGRGLWGSSLALPPTRPCSSEVG